MRYFIDTEYDFVVGPNGASLTPISIGIVAEDGREFYSILTMFHPHIVSDFVRDHVLTKFHPEGLGLAPAHCDREIVAADIKRFIGDATPEFWGEYSAFDYAVLSIIMGGFDQWPDGWPMWINDIKQEAIPEVSAEFPHNALSDARAVRDAFNWSRQVTA